MLLACSRNVEDMAELTMFWGLDASWRHRHLSRCWRSIEASSPPEAGDVKCGSYCVNWADKESSRTDEVGADPPSGPSNIRDGGTSEMKRMRMLRWERSEDSGRGSILAAANDARSCDVGT